MKLETKILLPCVFLYVFAPCLWTFSLIYSGMLKTMESIHILTSIPALIFISFFFIIAILLIRKKTKDIKRYYDNPTIETELIAQKSFKRIIKIVIIMGFIFVNIGPLVGYSALAFPQVGFFIDKTPPNLDMTTFLILSTFLSNGINLVFTVPFSIISTFSLEKLISRVNITKKSIFSINSKMIINNLFTIIGSILVIIATNLATVRFQSNSDKLLDLIIEKNIVIGSLVVIVSGISLFLTMRQITRPINKMSNTINEMFQNIKDGEANLTKNIEITNRDEIGVLAVNLNNFIDYLNKMLLNIRSSIDQISNGTNQISSSSQYLAQGTARQASAIEEINASLNENLSHIKQNLDNINNTSEIVIRTKDISIKGNEQMKQLVEAMNKINESTKEINKIVDIIDDIAFQTNLLSLNADIEASRVGKYGKGFAVVANSVRTLANKSTISVKETSLVIESTIKQIEMGYELVKLAAEYLDKITEESVKAASYVSEVAQSNEIQASSIESVASSIDDIDDVIQSNNANAEENAASCEELASQTNMVKDMISMFKLKSV